MPTNQDALLESCPGRLSGRGRSCSSFLTCLLWRSMLLLHETVVDRVRPGMSAQVRPESSPQRILVGRVHSVSPLPVSDQGSRTGNDVKYYVGRISLDTVPQGSHPGMTAEVSIATVQAPGVPVRATSSTV